MKKTPEKFVDEMRLEDGNAARELTPAEKDLVLQGIIGYLREIGIGVANRPLEIGDCVKWTSSGVPKRGEILAIVPPGSNPEKLGYKAGGGGMSRDHVSYVIKGRRLRSDGSAVGPFHLYWPQTSLVERETI